jgi:hypothetical protein
MLLPWRCGWQVTPECQMSFTGFHGITSQMKEDFVMTGPDDPWSCWFLTSVKNNWNDLHIVISSNFGPLRKDVVDASSPNILMKFSRCHCKQILPHSIFVCWQKEKLMIHIRNMLLLTYFLSHRHGPTKMYLCAVCLHWRRGFLCSPCHTKGK